MKTIARQVRELQGIVLSRYLLASAVALIVDFAVFVQLIALQLLPFVASALAYSLGVIVHWGLSSRLVFVGRVAISRKKRAAQQAQFLVSALIGLGITAGVVGTLTWFGLDPRLSKLFAVIVSFASVWYIRNNYVFGVREKGGVTVVSS